MTFDQLIAQYRPLIVRRVAYVLRDEADREECVQDVLLRLWRAYEEGRLPAEEKLKGYITLAARHTAFDRRESNSCRTAVLAESLEADLGDDEPSYEGLQCAAPEVTSTPMTRAVALAAEQLPADLAEVIRLRFTEDLDVQEIAFRLGILPTTVRNRLSRDLARLRNIFVISDTRAA